jgi:hypothetical protein
MVPAESCHLSCVCDQCVCVCARARARATRSRRPLWHLIQGIEGFEGTTSPTSPTRATWESALTYIICGCQQAGMKVWMHAGGYLSAFGDMAPLWIARPWKLFVALKPRSARGVSTLANRRSRANCPRYCIRVTLRLRYPCRTMLDSVSMFNSRHLISSAFALSPSPSWSPGSSVCVSD